jgi:hypothetical protein
MAMAMMMEATEAVNSIRQFVEFVFFWPKP